MAKAKEVILGFFAAVHQVVEPSDCFGGGWIGLRNGVLVGVADTGGRNRVFVFIIHGGWVWMHNVNVHRVAANKLNIKSRATR